MRESIILTVFNRTELTLLNTFLGIWKQGLDDDTEIIVVDDGSTHDYTDLRRSMGFELKWFRHDTVKERPETYHIDGHNNPVYANNMALSHARGDYVLWLSSDVILPPGAMESARKTKDSVWIPRTVDMDTAVEFCGMSRLFPMMWAVYAPRQECIDCGGFDEAFLKGMAFEDNDFMGRLCDKVGRLDMDLSTTAWHQSHPQTAYSDDMKGFKRSEAYITEKWGGVPWAGGQDDPIRKDIRREGERFLVDIHARDVKCSPF